MWNNLHFCKKPISRDTLLTLKTIRGYAKNLPRFKTKTCPWILAAYRNADCFIFTLNSSILSSADLSFEQLQLIRILLFDHLSNLGHKPVSPTSSRGNFSSANSTNFLKNVFFSWEGLLNADKRQQIAKTIISVCLHCSKSGALTRP